MQDVKHQDYNICKEGDILLALTNGRIVTVTGLDMKKRQY